MNSTDPNLLKIKESNMYSITHGSVQKAIEQAEDYLRYIHGYNEMKMEEELSLFINEVKEIRKQSRQKRKN